MPTWPPMPEWASYPTTRRNAVWLAQRELDDSGRLPTLAAEGLEYIRSALDVRPDLHVDFAAGISKHTDALVDHVWRREFVSERVYDRLAETLDAVDEAQQSFETTFSDRERNAAARLVHYLDTAWRLCERILDHVHADVAIRRLRRSGPPSPMDAERQHVVQRAQE